MRVERLDLGNMIAVNDVLGFELVPPPAHTVELDVAALLGAAN